MIRGALAAAALSVLGWVLLLGLVLLVSACGEPPRASYVLEPSGLRVSDAAELTTPQTLSRVVALIMEAAPREDLANILLTLDGATLTLEPEPHLATECDGETGGIGGCWHPNGTMNVAWRGCSDDGVYQPAWSILAHEVGHLIGHDHGDAWFRGVPLGGEEIGEPEARLWVAQCFGSWP